jgi:hypothetical protein
VQQAPRQREAVDADDLVDEHGVDVRQRGVADAFAGALDVGQHAEGRVEQGDVLRVDQAVVVERAQVGGHAVDEPLRAVGVVLERGALVRGDERGELGGVVLVAQAQAQGVGEADGEEDEAAAADIEGGGRVGGEGGARGWADPVQDLADEAALGVDEGAPQGAALPVAVVRGGRAKPEEHAEGEAGQGERQGGDVLDDEQAELDVADGQQDRQAEDEQQAPPDPRQDGAAEREDVADPGPPREDDHGSLKKGRA